VYQYCYNKLRVVYWYNDAFQQLLQEPRWCNAFDWYPNQRRWMTLNWHWAANGHYALCCITYILFGGERKNL